jgi:hypothetical protein
MRLFKWGRKRREFRYKSTYMNRTLKDIEIATMYAGAVLSKSEVLKLFGYSPKTYFHDTSIKSRGLVRQKSKDEYIVVSPDG